MIPSDWLNLINVDGDLGDFRGNRDGLLLKWGVGVTGDSLLEKVASEPGLEE